MGFFKDLFGPRQPCDLCQLGNSTWPNDRSASADWKLRGEGLHADLFICVSCRSHVLAWGMRERMPIFALARMVVLGHAARPEVHAYLQHPEWRKIWMHMLEKAGQRPASDFEALEIIEAVEQQILDQAQEGRQENPILERASTISDERAGNIRSRYRQLLITTGFFTIEDGRKLEDDSRPTREIYRDAHRDLQEGEFASAALKFERVIHEEPSNGEAHFMLGATFLSGGHVEAAYECMNTAIELDPTNGPCHTALGKIQTVVAPAEALATLQRACELDSGNAEAWGFYGDELSRRGAVREAGRAFEKAVQLQPDYFERHPDHHERFTEWKELMEDLSNGENS